MLYSLHTQAPPCFPLLPVLQATESWAGPGYEANPTLLCMELCTSIPTYITCIINATNLHYLRITLCVVTIEHLKILKVSRKGCKQHGNVYQSVCSTG